MDVLSIIKKEHRAVAAMFDEIKKCESGDKKIVELAKKIQKELSTHLTIEERLFYGRIRDRVDEEDERVDIFEAYTEHDGAKHLLEVLKSERKHDAKFKAELQVLGENVNHHVKEEESKVFALAREVMDRAELEKIGKEWERARSAPAPARKKAPSARRRRS